MEPGTDTVLIGGLLSWLVVGLALPGGWILGLWLRNRPRLQLAVWALVGFLPFFGPVDLALVFDRAYLGDAHGYELALIDLLVLSLFAAHPPATRRVPYRFALVVYLAAVAFSVTQASSPIHASFSLWKLLRMYFVFVVLVRAAGRQQVVMWVLGGMMAGTMYEFVLVLGQRFVMYQSPGSFSHQNSLGVALVLVLMAPTALVLARRTNLLTAVVPAAGLVTVVLTRSRGALMFFLLGAILVYVLSLMRAFALRKIAVGFLAIVLASALWMKTSSAIIERFESAPPESIATRLRYERAAAAMLNDHPAGVGANHFTFMLCNRGYGERADIQSEGDLRGIVHNIYWLTAAELGYAGALALAWLFLAPLAGSLRHAFQARDDIRGDVLLGLGVGLGMCYLHGLYEWVWRATDISYLFWMTLAMAGALRGQIGDAIPKAGAGARGPAAAPFPAG